MKKLIKNFLFKNIFKNNGRTRTVFTFEKLNIVIKIPTIFNGYEYLLLGIITNFKEYKNSTLLKSKYKDINNKNFDYEKISPTYFSLFGLINIQQYAYILHNDELSNDEMIFFKNITNDFYYKNFGYISTIKSKNVDKSNLDEFYDNLKLVCVDYGSINKNLNI